MSVIYFTDYLHLTCTCNFLILDDRGPQNNVQHQCVDKLLCNMMSFNTTPKYTSKLLMFNVVALDFIILLLYCLIFKIEETALKVDIAGVGFHLLAIQFTNSSKLLLHCTPLSAHEFTSS